MSRKIAFRVWDIRHKEMTYPDLFWFEEEGIREVPEDARGYEIMQFTGLTDKHGKDIYEGDIVKWEYEDAVGWHKTKRPVKWVAEDAYFDVPVERRWIRNVEIIGNVYEQPELLQKAGEA